MHRPHLEFALALHRELSAAWSGPSPSPGPRPAPDLPPGNLCWSPYSVAAALGMAAAGAHGATRDELAAALAPDGALDELQRVLAASASLPDAEAAVANALWMDVRREIYEDYQQQVLGRPGGALHTTDFRDDPDGSRVKINEDVEQATRGLVKELLAAGTISRETAAVLVNALYLKVAWQSAFAESATAPADFHAPSGTRQVPTMRQQESFGYAAAGGWRMVTLPTASTVVVDVLLPEHESAPLSAGTLAELKRASRSHKVDLALPRFRVEHAAVLNDHLRRLGVTTAFTADADFSGITPERIRFDLVVHKAVLRVDEQGFEGAAATAVVMRTVSMDLSKPVPFHVDRPFLVLVRNPRTGAIYFLARVAEP